MTTAATRPGTVRVVIIDDHLMVAESLADVLTASKMRVVGVTPNLTDGRALVAAEQPDVVLLDQRLPDGDGLSQVASLLEASPTSRVLLVTGFESQGLLLRALDAGCVGVVSKQQGAAALVEAVTATARGDCVVSQDELVRALQSRGEHRRKGLTRREQEVLGLLARGRPTSAIARLLGIAEPTTRNHIQRILVKLGAHSKLEAVTIALRDNLVSRDGEDPPRRS